MNYMLYLRSEIKLKHAGVQQSPKFVSENVLACCMLSLYVYGLVSSIVLNCSKLDFWNRISRQKLPNSEILCAVEVVLECWRLACRNWCNSPVVERECEWADIQMPCNIQTQLYSPMPFKNTSCKMCGQTSTHHFLFSSCLAISQSCLSMAISHPGCGH